MKLKLYQVDAFTDKVFSGNPAAVCPLENWLDDQLLQQIAMENNLAETAFFIKDADGFQIRWFTPTIEVDLCGHATLAAAYVLYSFEGYQRDTINFYSSRSGKLTVKREENFLLMDFPSDVYREVALFDGLVEAIGIQPLEVLKGKTDYMLVLKNEDQVLQAVPNLTSIAKLEARGLIITARGEKVDFVSRFFAPQSGVNEDPVTGSAHTTLIPYWAKKLGKNELVATQLSSRRGHIRGKYLGDRVEIIGQAKAYLTGEIRL